MKKEKNYVLIMDRTLDDILFGRMVSQEEFESDREQIIKVVKAMGVWDHYYLSTAIHRIQEKINALNRYLSLYNYNLDIADGLHNSIKALIEMYNLLNTYNGDWIYLDTLDKEEYFLVLYTKEERDRDMAAEMADWEAENDTDD